MTSFAKALAAFGILCATHGGAAAEPSREVLVRGFVQTGDASGTWTLRRCGDTADVPVHDKTAGDTFTVAVAEVKRSMQDRRRPVFVEFQGIVDREQAVVQRLWRVLGHVPDCAKVPGNIAADATLWAAGNEPSWLLVVRAKTATFTRFGRQRLAFPSSALKPQAPRRTYEARAGATWLRIEVDEEPCLDTMAEAAFGARVTATVREKGRTETLRGCAARY